MGYPLSLRVFLVAIVGLGFADLLNAQEKDQLRIALDPSIRPETLHVYSYLAGKFGGYGDFTDQTKASKQNVFLPTYHKGQRATSLKAVFYAEGCEFVTLVLDPLPLDPGPLRFDCHKLASVWLKGVVKGYPHASELRVQVRYMAYWSHTVFGIVDGMAPALAIADVVPDRDGSFAVQLPDFANDPATKSVKNEAEWSIIASKTGTEDRYWLNSDAPSSKIPGALPIRPGYPEQLSFTAQHF